MNDSRIKLALAACEGLSDQELAKRGTGSFAKMIARKRGYATSSRILCEANKVLSAELVTARNQLADKTKELCILQQTVAALEALEAPITSTSEAAALLAGIGKHPSA